MSRGGFVVLISLFFVVFVVGCMEGGNFVYLKGKIIGFYKEFRYFFKGFVDLDVNVFGNGLFILLIVFLDGLKEIFKRGNVIKVKEIVKFFEGFWKVIIRNEGGDFLSFDISLKGK